MLSDLFIWRGTPAYLRSDNGSEFSCGVVRGWLARLGVGPLFIEPGSLQRPTMFVNPLIV